MSQIFLINMIRIRQSSFLKMAMMTLGSVVVAPTWAYEGLAKNFAADDKPAVSNEWGSSVSGTSVGVGLEGRFGSCAFGSLSNSPQTAKETPWNKLDDGQFVVGPTALTANKVNRSGGGIRLDFGAEYAATPRFTFGGVLSGRFCVGGGEFSFPVKLMDNAFANPQDKNQSVRMNDRFHLQLHGIAGYFVVPRVQLYGLAGLSVARVSVRSAKNAMATYRSKGSFFYGGVVGGGVMYRTNPMDAVGLEFQYHFLQEKDARLFSGSARKDPLANDFTDANIVKADVMVKCKPRFMTLNLFYIHYFRDDGGFNNY